MCESIYCNTIPVFWGTLIFIFFDGSKYNFGAQGKFLLSSPLLRNQAYPSIVIIYERNEYHLYSHTQVF